jgi:hypothetical protein
MAWAGEPRERLALRPPTWAEAGRGYGRATAGPAGLPPAGATAGLPPVRPGYRRPDFLKQVTRWSSITPTAWR